METGCDHLRHGFAEAEESALREQAYKDGMKPLRVAGALKVAQGLTTAEEVLKVVPLTFDD